jgi:prepilin-type N-terminal cleavage/methylation domain-containing protein
MLNILNSRKGFTLVELLVTLAISGVVMAGVYSVFYTQQKSYTTQEQVSEMQQNLRACMLMMSRDARMAGFSFGPSGISYYDGSGTKYLSAIEGFNNNPDRIDIIYADASVSAKIDKHMPDSAGDLKVDSTAGFSDGDLIIITDGTNASLLEVTNVQSDGLVHNAAAGNINPPGGHNTFPPGGYDVGCDVYKVKYVSYDIDNTSDPAHPKMRVDLDGPLGSGNPQPLALNIEDLQFRYFFADGGEANAPDNLDADDTNDSDDIRSVRINILARSDKVDPGFTGNRPAIEDHTAGGTDSYRRRLLTTEIKVRNLGLQP